MFQDHTDFPLSNEARIEQSPKREIVDGAVEVSSKRIETINSGYDFLYHVVNSILAVTPPVEAVNTTHQPRIEESPERVPAAPLENYKIINEAPGNLDQEQLGALVDGFHAQSLDDIRRQISLIHNQNNGEVVGQ